MKNQPKRICIYPKDIQTVTGKSYRQSVRIFAAMKKSLNKGTNQYVAISEMCEYLGLKSHEVEPLILR